MRYYGKRPGKATILRKLYTYKKLNAYESKISAICDGKEALERRREVYNLANKYNIQKSQTDSLIKYFLANTSLSIESALNSLDYISSILKSIYNYSEEEVSNFFNRNILIAKNVFTDLRDRLSIFNHIGLLDDVVFKGSYFLTYDFTRNNFPTS